MDLNKINSLKTLQHNAEEFFKKIQNHHSLKMNCKEGCSKCCYVDLSVFEIESERVKAWFLELSDSKKSELKLKWKTNFSKMGENAKGESQKACDFLIDDSCSIYEARPLICRTQGAPLFFQEQNLFDVCPLNFADQEIPEKKDWLNVDRLNTLLSIVQGGSDKRIRLTDLKMELMNL